MFKRIVISSICLVCLIYIITDGYTQDIIVKSEKFYSIIPRDAKPILLIDKSQTESKLPWGEGPSWMNGKLYFTGLIDKGIYTYESDGTLNVLNKDSRYVGTTPLTNGNLAVCADRNVIEMSSRGEVIRVIADTSMVYYDGIPNDIITDSKGGLYFTVIARSTELKSNTVFTSIQRAH